MKVRGRVASLALAVLAQLAMPVQASTSTAFWSASYTRELTNSFVAGDAIENAPRSFALAHRFLAQSPGLSMPMTIAATMTDPPADLRSFPAVTPTTDADGRATYTWSNSGFVSSSLVDFSAHSSTPGFSATRTLAGGREIAAGATVTREFAVRIEVGEPLQFMTATIVFQPSFSPPGSAPLPVSASNVSCPTGVAHPTNPAWVNWFALSGAPGSVTELTCTADLTNSSDATAMYTPGVEIYAFQHLFEVAGRAVLQTDTGALSLTYGAQPPSDVEASGTLTGQAVRKVTFESENRTIPPQAWSGSMVRLVRAATQGDVLTSEVQSAHWSFSVNTHPVSWPAEIQVTTPIDPTQLMAFPAVAPVSSGTDHTYTWSGETPADPVDGTVLFGASLFAADGAVDGDLGYSVQRALSGGRVVPAGATEARELTVTLAVTGATQRITVNVGFAGAPGLPVAATDVSCPGAIDFGWAWGWTLISPTVGSTHMLTCTFSVTHVSDADASYMPSVFIWSSRSFTWSAAQPGATRLEMTDDALGTVAFEVTPPVGTAVEGSTSFVDIATTNMFFENRELPRATTLELLTTGRLGTRSGEAIEAKLSRSITGAGVAGRMVWFELKREGGRAETVISPLVVTDATGVARFAPPASMLPGHYSVRAVFAGDPAYLRSEDSGELLITRGE